MLELKGKYNTAKIFTDNVDSATIGQVMALLNQESMSSCNIRIMPDTHAGAGCVIGTTMTIHGRIIPNLVGVDIGCGMAVIALSEKRIDLPKLDSLIHKDVPAGFNIRNKQHKYCENINIDNLRCVDSVDLNRAYLSIGTLGGGNHFIEVDKDNEGFLYLVIHTGSRNLGKQVAEYYQKEAWKQIQSGNRGELIQKKIAELTAAGKQSEIENAIKEIRNEVCSVPRELAYCEDRLFDDYIHDMKIVQEYAYWNREAIADAIVKGMNFSVQKDDCFQTIHNYIDTENMILRKGSVSAKAGEKLIIPINMRDGSLICIGKGNEDWNQSAPHGAGRLMSRSQAKQSFTVSEFKKTMEAAGVFTTSVGKDTLDECPMTYKPMDEIVENIKPTVDICNVIKPIYNFKAGGD